MISIITNFIYIAPFTTHVNGCFTKAVNQETVKPLWYIKSILLVRFNTMKETKDI